MLECVGHSFAFVTHFDFLRDVCVLTQRAAEARRCSTNLATHLPILHLTSHPSYMVSYNICTVDMITVATVNRTANVGK
jgi:hypothetical protein